MPLVPRLALTTPGVTLPVPIAPIMLSPPPALTTTSVEKPYFCAISARSVPAATCDGESGGSQSARFLSSALITADDHVRLRTSISAVPDAVAVLHEVFTGEMEIQVVVRQQHVAQAAVVRGLVAFQPENFRRRETREKREACFADRGFFAAELLRKDRALGGGARVAPQFRRTDYVALFVERNEAVLLTGDADAAHARAINLRGDLEDDAVERRGPFLRVLLHVAGGQAGDERVRRARLGDDRLGVEVEDDRLGALRTAVDADEEGHGGGTIRDELGEEKNPRAASNASRTLSRRALACHLRFSAKTAFAHYC